MWRHWLVLALGGLAVFPDIDATDTGPSGELSSNDESKEEEVENSGVVSLQSKDFAQALQAHSLLMVGIFIIVKICATKFCAPW